MDIRVSFSGLVPLVTLVFVVLKLCGQINWSWLWVFSPMWITGAVALFCGLLYALLCMLDR